ncbi:hypothetical protein QBC41DRAFT_397572 [Cercophora samala]|uniref:Uncharacterized protein n=1 Tax=Cercophora samala TaxID=330535 RepID=A0AA40D806_9PEZI|nr:hypothetical protein QBC41DRAFT_397572 [Cercophora samala]
MGSLGNRMQSIRKRLTRSMTFNTKKEEQKKNGKVQPGDDPTSDAAKTDAAKPSKTDGDKVTPDTDKPASNPDSPLPKPAPKTNNNNNNNTPPPPKHQSAAYTLTTFEAHTVIDWHYQSQARYDTLQQEKYDLQAKHDKLQAEYHEVKDARANAVAKAKALRERCDELVAASVGLKRDVARLQVENDTLLEDFQKKAEMLDVQRARFETLEVEFAKHVCPVGVDVEKFLEAGRERLEGVE